MNKNNPKLLSTLLWKESNLEEAQEREKADIELAKHFGGVSISTEKFSTE